MTYPADIESRLGFDQIRHRLLENCLGELGKKHVYGIHFQTQFPGIEILLKQNLEAATTLQRGEEIPLSFYDDPQHWFQTASLEGNFLEGDVFLKIAKALQILRTANEFLRKREMEYPALFQLTVPEGTGKKFESAIRAKIDEEGRVRDNATPELSGIRRRIRDEESKVRKIAEQIIRKAIEQGWTPEGSNPTIRDGRLVIPMTTEHKRKIRGYVVDQSATGQTVYMEPGEVMEANNDLRDLQLAERKEVIRILKELTSLLRENLPELESGYEFMGRLDFTRAKAIFSRSLDASLPILLKTPALQWREARHPLLYLSFKDKKRLVALSVELKPDDRFLLVSGPNAGGKSVSLKTVGLIQYMLQCGLLVPMNPDSVMGIFGKIFLDIGDQQSIENDLSTYSSHLKNMDYFLRNAGNDSIVLLDELGSGTDPNFGGGIAQAVLEKLVSLKVWGLATTHYYNLKVFASNFQGIRNAAMKFDNVHLVPLFQLETGQPGSSFALEIARKTGLSDETLQAAERIIGKDLTGLETLMKQVAEEKQRLIEREKDVRTRESSLSTTLKHYESLSAELESRKKEILNSAKAEASTLLQQTNREIEKTIRHIRENKAEKQETRKVRLGLKELEKKVKPIQGLPVKPVGPLVAGDKVRMIGGGVTGTILALKGKTASVQFGDLRSTVKSEQLIRTDQIEADKPRRPSFHGVEMHQRQSAFSSLLDIRGKRVEEIQPLLVRFMDDAVLLGLSEVRILHGKGEGVLRKVVRDYLKKLKSVSSHQDEHADRGGDGMTIVKLSQ